MEPADSLDDEAIIGSYETAAQAHDAGLAVLAAGHYYWIEQVEDRYVLLVSRQHAGRLRREIAIATARNRFWPPSKLELTDSSVDKAPTIVALLGLVGMFAVQQADPRLAEVGANASEAVLQDGEWWRIVTATTLHADISHLAGNLMGLSFFGYLTCRYFRNGVGWLLILASAVLANLASSYFNLGEDYRSLGASTLVFGALGLITGYPIGAFVRTRSELSSRDWLVPFFGGCVLFAWMGGGEFPTDVGAHLASFAIGVILAATLSWTNFAAKLSPAIQTVLLAVAAAIPIASWATALAH